MPQIISMVIYGNKEQQGIFSLSIGEKSRTDR
jgi:hypothetical protein